MKLENLLEPILIIGQELTKKLKQDPDLQDKIIQIYKDNPPLFVAAVLSQVQYLNDNDSGQDSGDGSANSGGSESARESGGGDSGNDENNSGDSANNCESGESGGVPKFLQRTTPKIPAMTPEQFMDYIVGNLAKMQKNKDDFELHKSIETALWDYCQLHGGHAMEDIEAKNIPPLLTALWDGWGKYFDDKNPTKDFGKLFELVKPTQS